MKVTRDNLNVMSALVAVFTVSKYKFMRSVERVRVIPCANITPSYCNK